MKDKIKCKGNLYYTHIKICYGRRYINKDGKLARFFSMQLPKTLHKHFPNLKSIFTDGEDIFGEMIIKR